MSEPVRIGEVWKRCFVVWPRRDVGGAWLFMSIAERRSVAWGGAVFGDVDFEYRLESA